MPAAYTHTYIAHLILERLAAATPTGDGKVRVALPPTPSGSATINLPAATVELLLENPASFCLGSASPDFFADVITGITTSHQPMLQGHNLAHFMNTFASSVNWQDPHQVAWLLGWFCHLCADVFGHHWVGKEAHGPFLSWFDTPPQVVRKHLGIEMVWAKQAQAASSKDFLALYVQKEFGRAIPLTPDGTQAERACLFQRKLVLDAMFTEGAPLCRAYYDQGSAATQVVKPLIRVRSWRTWHADQVKKIRKLQAWNNSLVGRFADFDLPRLSPQQLADMRLDCPLCEAHGQMTHVVEAACPTCVGTGFVERAVLGVCPFCDKEQHARVNCPTCEGLPDALRDACPDCHGKREVNVLCPFCGATRGTANYARGKCQHCKGAKTIRQELDADCPFCKGQKALEKVLGDPKFSSQDLINLICDRLCIYHEARRQRIDRLVDTYQEAHERLTLLMIESNGAPGVMAVKGCFGDFMDQAKDFAISQLTFSDLVPELAVYEANVSASIEKVFDLYMKLVPADWLATIEKLKAQVLDTAFSAIAEYLGNPLLTDAEETAVNRVLARQSLAALAWRRLPLKAVRMRRRPAVPLLFAPVADAVTLFLLSMDGCAPTRSGLAAAFNRLGAASNIDTTDQPTELSYYNDVGFTWDARFRLVGKTKPGEEGQLRIGI